MRAVVLRSAAHLTLPEAPVYGLILIKVHESSEPMPLKTWTGPEDLKLLLTRQYLHWWLA